MTDKGATIRKWGYNLPRTHTFNYYESDEGEKVEFRLIYQGPLPAEKYEDKGVPGSGAVGKAKDKHRLRKHFHLQLRELWKRDPGLIVQSESWFTIHTTPANMLSFPGPGARQILPAMPGSPGSKGWLDWIADSHVRCNGNRFVPLVSKAGGFTCALDILFLRRDDPGGLIDHGGDIDNRIKVLLDGLRMPVDVKELGGYTIDTDEDPFYCLLEDDSLITKISVVTDRLIVPKETQEAIHDVWLVIRVEMVNPMLVFAGGRLV